jgi:hypothetical protein
MVEALKREIENLRAENRALKDALAAGGSSKEYLTSKIGKEYRTGVSPSPLVGVEHIYRQQLAMCVCMYVCVCV